MSHQKTQPLFAVGALQTIVDGEERTLTHAEAKFLIARVRKLERENVGLDLAAQHWQEECRQHELDLWGLQSQFDDLNIELLREKERVQLLRIQMGIDENIPGLTDRPTGAASYADAPLSSEPPGGVIEAAGGVC